MQTSRSASWAGILVIVILVLLLGAVAALYKEETRSYAESAGERAWVIGNSIVQGYARIFEGLRDGMSRAERERGPESATAGTGYSGQGLPPAPGYPPYPAYSPYPGAGYPGAGPYPAYSPEAYRQGQGGYGQPPAGYAPPPSGGVATGQDSAGQGAAVGPSAATPGSSGGMPMVELPDNLTQENTPAQESTVQESNPAEAAGQGYGQPAGGTPGPESAGQNAAQPLTPFGAPSSPPTGGDPNAPGSPFGTPPAADPLSEAESAAPDSMAVDDAQTGPQAQSALAPESASPTGDVTASSAGVQTPGVQTFEPSTADDRTAGAQATDNQIPGNPTQDNQAQDNLTQDAQSAPRTSGLPTGESGSVLSPEAVADSSAAGGDASAMTPGAPTQAATAGQAPAASQESQVRQSQAQQSQTQARGTPPAGENVYAAREAAIRGNYTEAAWLYQRYLATHPDDMNAYGELGNVFMLAGQPRQAAQAYYEAANRLLDRGAVRNVAPLMPIIQQYDPMLATLLQRKAQAARQPAGDAEGGVVPSAYSPPQPGTTGPSAPAPTPDPFTAARHAAIHYRYEEAIRLYQQHLSSHPDDANAHGELGNVYLQAGHSNEAARSYYEAAVDMVAAGNRAGAVALYPIIARYEPALASALQTRLQ